MLTDTHNSELDENFGRIVRKLHFDRKNPIEYLMRLCFNLRGDNPEQQEDWINYYHVLHSQLYNEDTGEALVEDMYT